MPIIRKDTIPEYVWGEVCMAWVFFKTEQLTIKEELMPSGTGEAAHYHQEAGQFFYILEGVATFVEDNQIIEVHAGDGFEVNPGTIHSIQNNGKKNLRFLLISHPAADQDRYEKDQNPGINLGGRRFVALSNSDSGEVSDETIFAYHQKGDIVWATYQGGDIVFGTLSGQILGQKLKFNYQHRNQRNEFMTGICHTDIKLVGGKIQLHEKWKWTCNDFSEGTSVLEEV